MILNPDSPIPLYFQLKEYLKGEILAGRLQEGEQLAPERELADQYFISRMTARQALQELAQEGYLARQSGRGTFVTRPGQHLRISSRGFTQDVLQMGLRPGSRVLACTEEPAPATVAYELRIGVGALAVRLERLQLADDEPIAHQVVWLPAARFTGLHRWVKDNGSLYTVLREVYGVVPQGGHRLIDCIPASPEEAALLSIEVKAPLLRLAGTTEDGHGSAVEYGSTVYRADRFRFNVI